MAGQRTSATAMTRAEAASAEGGTQRRRRGAGAGRQGPRGHVTAGVAAGACSPALRRGREVGCAGRLPPPLILPAPAVDGTTQWGGPSRSRCRLLTQSSGSREHQAMVMWLLQYLIPQIVTHQIWDGISLTVVRASDWPNRLSNCDFWKENLNLE